MLSEHACKHFLWDYVLTTRETHCSSIVIDVKRHMGVCTVQKQYMSLHV